MYTPPVWDTNEEGIRFRLTAKDVFRGLAPETISGGHCSAMDPSRYGKVAGRLELVNRISRDRVCESHIHDVIQCHMPTFAAHGVCKSRL